MENFFSSLTKYGIITGRYLFTYTRFDAMKEYSVIIRNLLKAYTYKLLYKMKTANLYSLFYF